MYIFKSLSEIQDEYSQVILSDYISKKRCFDDSEITGWLLIKDLSVEGFKLFHLYQRGYVIDSDEIINEFGIYQNEEITDSIVLLEIQNLLSLADKNTIPKDVFQQLHKTKNLLTDKYVQYGTVEKISDNIAIIIADKTKVAYKYLSYSPSLSLYDVVIFTRSNANEIVDLHIDYYETAKRNT